MGQSASRIGVERSCCEILRGHPERKPRFKIQRRAGRHLNLLTYSNKIPLSSIHSQWRRAPPRSDPSIFTMPLNEYNHPRRPQSASKVEAATLTQKQEEEWNEKLEELKQYWILQGNHQGNDQNQPPSHDFTGIAAVEKERKPSPPSERLKRPPFYDYKAEKVTKPSPPPTGSLENKKDWQKIRQKRLQTAISARDAARSFSVPSTPVNDNAAVAQEPPGQARRDLDESLERWERIPPEEAPPRRQDITKKVRASSTDVEPLGQANQNTDQTTEREEIKRREERNRRKELYKKIRARSLPVEVTNEQQLDSESVAVPKQELQLQTEKQASFVTKNTKQEGMVPLAITSQTLFPKIPQALPMGLEVRTPMGFGTAIIATKTPIISILEFQTDSTDASSLTMTSTTNFFSFPDVLPLGLEVRAPLGVGAAVASLQAGQRPIISILVGRKQGGRESSVASNALVLREEM